MVSNRKSFYDLYVLNLSYLIAAADCLWWDIGVCTCLSLGTINKEINSRLVFLIASFYQCNTVCHLVLYLTIWLLLTYFIFPGTGSAGWPHWWHTGPERMDLEKLCCDVWLWKTWINMQGLLCLIFYGVCLMLGYNFLLFFNWFFFIFIYFLTWQPYFSRNSQWDHILVTL